VNGVPVEALGFGMDSTKTRYYISDFWNDKIYILNDEYQYISQKTFYSPAKMITIGENMYIAGDSYVWKTNKDLNVLIQYNRIGSRYIDIYFNSTNSLMYVTAAYNLSIHVFDLNLNLINTISLSNEPFAITGFNNRMYVGCVSNPTLVIENQQIINTFDGCDFVTSIIFDQSGYMATSCYGERKLYLYDNNLSYTGKSISIDDGALTIAFDSKGRFVVVSSNQISIYY
jgi:hypothetical protein